MASGSSWSEVARRRYWREDDARAVVAAWHRSGEGRAQFCRTHGIAVARLSRWAARLHPRADPPATFHPVQVSEERRGGGAVLVVELPGVATIRLEPGFALEDLRRVLQAFEADAC